ncbi:hypothetical protein DL765_010104 [Monosporascus sp. GIB2]|nr:hypothetical protein DL765_010104 [Monosporascus sp. GIB2]
MAHVDYGTKINNLNKPLTVAVTAHDLRYASSRLTWQKGNFELIERPTDVTAEQFLDKSPEGKKFGEGSYYRDCKTLVEEMTGCKNVVPHAGLWDNTREDAPDRRLVEVQCWVFYYDE